jgi:serine/threonine protein kinase
MKPDPHGTPDASPPPRTSGPPPSSSGPEEVDPLVASSFDDFNEAKILEQFEKDSPAQAAPLTPDQQSVDLRPGIVINKRFKVLKQLGFGGMGAVYLVKDTHLRERRALKVMLPRLLSNAQAQRRFLIETKVTQRLAHENIVRVHDLGMDFDSGMQFFTMALVEGETLYKYQKRRGGQIPYSDVLPIARQVCDALAYAHRTTIHRDLKPQNIMRGEDGHVTILDFGLAKLLDQSNPAFSRMAVGTASYQAPEQRTNPLNIDKRADLFAMGIIMYQLLTGKLPVGKYTPASRVVRGVPRRMDATIQRCLKKRNERYSSAGELREDLDSSSHGGLRRLVNRIRPSS